VRHFAHEDITRLNSMIKDYEKLSICLMDKIHKLETEKVYLIFFLANEFKFQTTLFVDRPLI
jgi:hypothetical protein